MLHPESPAERGKRQGKPDQIYNLCTLLKTQEVEHPENNFKESTLEESQELIDLIGNKPSRFIDFYTKFQPFEVPTFWNSDVGLLSIEQCHLDKVFYDENSISYAVMH